MEEFEDLEETLRHYDVRSDGELGLAVGLEPLHGRLVRHLYSVGRHPDDEERYWWSRDPRLSQVRRKVLVLLLTEAMELGTAQEYTDLLANQFDMIVSTSIVQKDLALLGCRKIHRCYVPPEDLLPLDYLGRIADAAS